MHNPIDDEKKIIDHTVFKDVQNKSHQKQSEKSTLKGDYPPFCTASRIHCGKGGRGIFSISNTSFFLIRFAFSSLTKGGGYPDYLPQYETPKEKSDCPSIEEDFKIVIFGEHCPIMVNSWTRGTEPIAQRLINNLWDCSDFAGDVSQGRIPLEYGKSEERENNSDTSSKEQLFIFSEEGSVGQYQNKKSAKDNSSGKGEHHRCNSDDEEQPFYPLLPLSFAPFHERREQQREECHKEIAVIIWTREKPLSTEGAFPASKVIKRRLLVELSVIQMEFVANP
jgi:hypothetical protein